MFPVLEKASLIKLRTILLYDSLYVILSLIAIIYSYCIINFYPYQSKYHTNDNVIEGYIHRYEIDGNKLTVILKGREKVLINYYFKTIDEKDEYSLKLGDYIKVSGSMKEPKSATVFNLFDYKKYLYRNKIFYIMTADKIEYIKSNIRLRYKIKQLIIDYINCFKKSSTYIKALVIGNNKEITNEVSKSYQLNGVSHLFAISGTHISFLTVIILWILKKLKIEENKRYYVVILFLLFYIFLTDYASSVLRSVVFFILLSINKMYYFNIKTINILQLTLFILLLFKPSLLYDIGFQFSFVISFYLVLYQSIITSSNHYFKQLFLISFIAFLVSIPICINNFFQINLLSPIINLFFVPYVVFILFPLSFLCLIFPFLDSILYFFVNILESVSLLLSNIKIGEIILSKPTFIGLMLYWIVITLCIRGMTRKKYYCLGLLIGLIIIHHNINYFNTDPYVAFLDVGQGDSIFINLPHNKGNILIDTGGKMKFGEPWQERPREYKIGEGTIIPYLKSIGVKELDYLILTHGDEDHMGESLDIVNNFKVKQVILNDGALVKLEEALIEQLNKLNIKYYFGKRGDVLLIDKYPFYILNPKVDLNENDNSIVLYTVLNGHKLLLAGDISSKVERDLIKEYSNLKVDILKLGHHGSITSTCEEFLDFLKPKYGIIQVGLNNRFNHPNEAVINRLIDKKVNLYQTSIDGSIKVILRANEVTFISAST